MINDNLIPKDWVKRDNIITVVGVGGGGGNAVTYMHSQDIEDVNFIICNTDVQALNMSPVPSKVQLGAVLTRGLGAGTDFLIGRKAAQESIEEIENMFSGSTEMVFVTCGMGGGTGTGAAPVICEVAKKKGYLTVGVVTIPFRDEGEEAIIRAVKGIKEMSQQVDSMLIIDNQKLYEIYGELDVFSAFPKADDVLKTAVKSIAEIITKGGYINADFADVKRIMQNSGVSLMGIGTASGPDRAIKAVENAFNSPLLNDLDFKTAKKALINISSSSEPGKALKASELSQIMDYIKSYIGETSTLKRGIVKNDSLGESISVTIIATGFDMSQLPSIDERSVNRENIIEVKYTQKFAKIKKSGVPLQPEGEQHINRKNRVEGKPSLIVDSVQQIAPLEEEAAYYRRERLINEQQKQEQIYETQGTLRS